MRQVICPTFDEKSGLVILKGNEYKHLVSVLRKRVGEHVSLRLSSGQLFDSEIVEISDGKVLCKLLSPLDGQDMASPLFILLQWELKGSKMDTVIRQATEVGVSHIIPVFGDYSISKTKNENEKTRREKIIRSAREQSGSPVETKLFSSTSINNAINMIEEIIKDRNTLLLLAYEKKEICSKNIFSIVEGKEEAIVVCIGAEGGISEEEYSILTNIGFKTIHFNTNILRAETATIYAFASVREAYYTKR
ncbi:MAG: RsmE family RNA methyltransferase [Treponema sp.]